MKQNVSLIICMLIFGQISLSHANTIKMGYFSLRPHMFEKNGNATGASVTYFEDVAQKMGHTVTWQGPLPLGRLLDMLEKGDIDGTLLFTHNLERTHFLYYPEKPYFLCRNIFVVKKDNRLEKIDSVNDVAGYRVGYMKGMNISGFLRDNTDKLKLEYVAGINWAEQNIRKVLNDRIDAAYDINHVTMRYEAALLGVEDQLTFIVLPVEPIKCYIVFSKKSTRDKKYTDQYNRINEQYTFSYDRFIKHYFDELNK